MGVFFMFQKEEKSMHRKEERNAMMISLDHVEGLFGFNSLIKELSTWQSL